MNDSNKKIHIELRDAVKMNCGFRTSVSGKGYISESCVVIERDGGFTEYYPWNNILAVQAYSDTQEPEIEEGNIVDERIRDMIHEMLRS